MNDEKNQEKILVFRAEDGELTLDVKFEHETVWLTQLQMAKLFEKTKQNISLHIKNCFSEGELTENESVVKESLTTAADGKEYKTKVYNLDVIISVGYRVKSKRGTQFRQWATQRLKEYIVQGYSINEKRLAEKNKQVQILSEGIKILNRAIENTSLPSDPQLLKAFAGGLSLLDDYDHKTLDPEGITLREVSYPSSADYMDFISSMYSDFASDVFAQPKDDSFNSSINQIRQSFGGKDVYPSIEEKAATLLYLIVKNHSFVDGNKRIAAACFLYFLKANSLLFSSKGEPIISNDALAGLTLFTAVSKPEEMDTVKKLIISVLNRNFGEFHS